MAGLALKVYLLSIMISFVFYFYTSSLDIGSTGSGSVTYNESLVQTQTQLQNKANQLFIANGVASAITVIGIVLDNSLVALAGFALVMITSMNIQQAVFNESFGGDLGNLISLILMVLYVLGIVSWWAGRNEP